MCLAIKATEYIKDCCAYCSITGHIFAPGSKGRGFLRGQNQYNRLAVRQWDIKQDAPDSEIIQLYTWVAGCNLLCLFVVVLGGAALLVRFARTVIFHWVDNRLNTLALLA